MEKKRKITIIIVILAILLGLSLALLAGVIAKKRRENPAPTAVTVTENHITPSSRETEETANSSEPATSGSVSSTEEKTSAEVMTSTEVKTSAEAQTSTEAQTSAEGKTSTEVQTSAEPISSTEALSSIESSTAQELSDPGISLYKRHAEENEDFRVGNMFPGDRETKSFRVRVSYHDEVTVHFLSKVREGYEKLAEVMMVEVRLSDSDEVLYDGLMRDMPDEVIVELSASENTVTELIYEITAYLDTGVGNDYQNLPLVADFRWWVEGEENLGPAPETGDNFRVLLWSGLSIASLSCLILLIFMRKREEERAV